MWLGTIGSWAGCAGTAGHWPQTAVGRPASCRTQRQSALPQFGGVAANSAGTVPGARRGRVASLMFLNQGRKRQRFVRLPAAGAAEDGIAAAGAKGLGALHRA